MDSLQGQEEHIEEKNDGNKTKKPMNGDDSTEAKILNHTAISDKEEEKLKGSSAEKKKKHKDKEITKKKKNEYSITETNQKKKKHAKIDTSSSSSSSSDSESDEDLIHKMKKRNNKTKKKAGKSSWLNVQDKNKWIWLGAFGGLLLVIGGAVMVMRKPKIDVRAQKQQRDVQLLTGE